MLFKFLRYKGLQKHQENSGETFLTAGSLSDGAGRTCKCLTGKTASFPWHLPQSFISLELFSQEWTPMRPGHGVGDKAEDTQAPPPVYLPGDTRSWKTTSIQYSNLQVCVRAVGWMAASCLLPGFHRFLAGQGQGVKGGANTILSLQKPRHRPRARGSTARHRWPTRGPLTAPVRVY